MAEIVVFQSLRTKQARPTLNDMRRVVVLAFPDFQLLDVTGPWEVFGRTTRWLHDHGRSGGYALELGASARGSGAAAAGLELAVHKTLGQVRGGLDTLVVAGGLGTRRALGDANLIRFVRSTARRARRTASRGCEAATRSGLREAPRAARVRRGGR